MYCLFISPAILLMAWAQYRVKSSYARAKLILIGLAAYAGLLVFQVVNLPVEFDASNRAKRVLSELHIVDDQGAVAVRDVLNAAGWTYVAATLQTLLTLLYYVLQFSGMGR